MAYFGDAFKKLSIKEGGYVNDKDDAGGETYRGISRKYNPTWQGWTMIDSYKKHYTVGSKEFKSKLDNDVQLQKLVWEKYKIGYWYVFFISVGTVPREAFFRRIPCFSGCARV